MSIAHIDESKPRRFVAAVGQPRIFDTYEELLDYELGFNVYPEGKCRSGSEAEILNVAEDTPEGSLLHYWNCTSIQRFSGGLTFLYNSSSCIMRHIYAPPCESRFRRSSAQTAWPDGRAKSRRRASTYF